MDLSPYLEYQRSQLQARRERRGAARKEAFEALVAMQPIFASAPELRRVYLFGSLERNRYREDSDIDLAVEGLGPEAFLALSSRLRSSTQREVDVVDLADCDEKFADFIRKFGRVIYERTE